MQLPPPNATYPSGNAQVAVSGESLQPERDPPTPIADNLEVAR